MHGETGETGVARSGFRPGLDGCAWKCPGLHDVAAHGDGAGRPAPIRDVEGVPHAGVRLALPEHLDGAVRLPAGKRLADRADLEAGGGRRGLAVIVRPHVPQVAIATFEQHIRGLVRRSHWGRNRALENLVVRITSLQRLLTDLADLVDTADQHVADHHFNIGDAGGRLGVVPATTPRCPATRS